MRSSSHKVLVTGGSRGIGLAIAQKFHATGNSVVLVGRDLAALGEAVQSMPGSTYIVADLSRPEASLDVFRAAPDISVLVNNAGIQVNGDFQSCDWKEVQHEVSTNLVGPLALTHAYLPTLRAHSESAVVNITSALAFVPKQSAAVYCATKAALRSFTCALRWQLEDSSVRVFEVVPPLVETGMTAGRGASKISPDAVASAFWQGYLADRPEILVGKARALKALAQHVPSVAERIIRTG